MAKRLMLAAFGLLIAASPVAASQRLAPGTPAPPGSPTTLYCLRITVTGYAIDPIQCWTRAEWAEQDVDVDKEWAANGVRTIG